MVLSFAPEAKYFPHVEKATDLTDFKCPFSTLTASPVQIDHIIIIASPPAEAI